MDKDARATQLLSTFHRTELYLISDHLMIVSHILIYVSKKAKHGGIVAGFVKLDFYIGVTFLS